MAEKEKATAEVTLKNKSGLHARPASLFVQKAARFNSDINVIKDDKKINAKSIMGILSSGIAQGTTIIIEAEGDDAHEAVDALLEIINQGFDEDD